MDKTCKDCVCNELCTTIGFNNGFKGGEQCRHFKDKSLFIELPCKVGDTVYYFLDGSNYKKYETVNVVGFHTDKYRTAFEIEVCGIKMRVDIGFLGEKIFLTREEAEQALKERKV